MCGMYKGISISAGNVRVIRGLSLIVPPFKIHFLKMLSSRNKLITQALHLSFSIDIVLRQNTFNVKLIITNGMKKSWEMVEMFAPSSARRNFFKCAPPNLKSWIRP
jgi:hypothetical protein